MPQEIRVLKCFKCDIFQGDIVKKAKSWQCKICGEKQSVMQEFGRGTGKECRQHIQKLNMKIRDANIAMRIKMQNDIDFYEPIAENVENLSKEQLMLPLLVNSNSSNYAHNIFPINYNTVPNDIKNINCINEDNHKNINDLTSESSQSTTINPFNKYQNNDRNLKRHSREQADNLYKKSKWCNYIKENENE